MTRSVSVIAFALVFASVLAGCGARSTPDRAHDDACESCLASGGTWQLDSCTRDCGQMDVACYRDRCPGPCSAATCGDCHVPEDCRAAGCAWQVEGEAMWCR